MILLANFIGIGAALLCTFTPQVGGAAEIDLPEESAALIKKLDEFQKTESLETEMKIEKAEKSALAILAKHQERETKSGNLDNVLALRKIEKITADTKVGADVPEDSKQVVLKFQTFAKKQREILAEEIAVKQRAVARILKRHVEEVTKKGEVETALAIRKEHDRIVAGIPKEPEKTKGGGSLKPIGEKSEVGRVLAKLSGEPAVIEVLHTNPITLEAFKDQELAAGKTKKWESPPAALLEIGTLVHVPTSSNGGVAEYKVTADGYVLISCDYAYQGNSSGGWEATRWKAADFIENGWKELDEKDMGGKMLTSKGGIRNVFYKKLKAGDEGKLRCNKYGPPIFLSFPTDDS